MTKYKGAAVASVIMTARMNKEMSQKALAKKLGLASPQYISNVERGLCPMSLEKLLKTCKILDIEKKLAKQALLMDFDLKVTEYGF